MLKSQLNYSCVNGVCFDKAATDIVATLRNAARDVADDVGLIDEEALRDHLPSGEWNGFCSATYRADVGSIGSGAGSRCETPLERESKPRFSGLGERATGEEIAAVSELDPRSGPQPPLRDFHRGQGRRDPLGACRVDRRRIRRHPEPRSSSESTRTEALPLSRDSLRSCRDYLA